MVLGIVSICISVIVVALYVGFRLRSGRVMGTFFMLLASYAFIAAGILSLLVSTNINNTVLAFVLLALSISFVGDVLIELKDDENERDIFLNLGMIMFAAHKILNFVALIALIDGSISWIPFTISVAIAVALTAIILTIAKLIKLDFKYFFPQIICYFFINTYVATLAVWFAILLPQLWLFSAAMLSFLVSDTILLHMHLGKREGKDTYFVLHNIFYFGAQLLIIAFLYFGFFSNF